MMARPLYLDTARLGRLTPMAEQASIDFARFAAEVGCPSYFECFLRDGEAALPVDVRNEFPALSLWQGIGSLKKRLRRLIGTSDELPVLLANRTAQLMKFAARVLFRPCRNVLTLDATWPTYREILESERRRASREISTSHVHFDILSGRVSESDLIAKIVFDFERFDCDGLFLPAVTSDGIRVPVESIVQQIESKHGSFPVVIDGAQDFCHTQNSLATEFCDMYLAGCHKWLGGYYPMGLLFYGRRRTRAFVETVLDQMLFDGDLDDPLLRFANQLQFAPLDGVSETVSLGSLFSCHGATLDAAKDRDKAYSIREANREAALRATDSTDWVPVSPASEFQTGVVVLRPDTPRKIGTKPNAVRMAFERTGVSLSAYDDGRIRLSMPDLPLEDAELQQLHNALGAV